MAGFENLKISFIAGQLNQGGTERQLFYILKTLRENGAEVHLLSLKSGGFWEQKIKDQGIEVIFVGKSRSRMIRLGYILKALKKISPHIVQSQDFFVNLYVVLAARLLGIKEIGAVRSTVENSMRDCGIFGRFDLFFPRILVLNSKSAVHEALQFGVPPARLHFLPNVVDCDEFCPGNRASNSGPLKILAVGRLTIEKRFDLFLESIAQLNNKKYSVVATIVGEGPKRAELEKKAAALGIKNVEFKGAQDDLRDFYRQADILVVSSETEGTPNVILEAMACALPIVATAVGGIPEIIENDRTGFLCGSGDVAAMTNRIERLIADKDLRMKMGSTAREYVLKNHSLPYFKALLSHLYQNPGLNVQNNGQRHLKKIILGRQ